VSRSSGGEGGEGGREREAAIEPRASWPMLVKSPRDLSPVTRMHARRYLVARDKSLVAHVIKSFSQGRRSKEN
jgi:hypothetical protein